MDGVGGGASANAVVSDVGCDYTTPVAPPPRPHQAPNEASGEQRLSVREFTSNFQKNCHGDDKLNGLETEHDESVVCSPLVVDRGTVPSPVASCKPAMGMQTNELSEYEDDSTGEWCAV